MLVYQKKVKEISAYLVQFLQFTKMLVVKLINLVT